METLNYCKSCICFCWLVEASCIISYSELSESSLIRDNDINNSNDDLGELIGELCFEQLCASVSNAVQKANAFNSDVNNTIKKNVFDYLPVKWAIILRNRHFKKYYSNRVAFHWFEGASITQLKKVGLITTSNDDEVFKNSFKHAPEQQRKRLSISAANYASNAKNKFKETFWNKCSKDYDCSEDCGCDDKDDSYGTSIGFHTINN
jgi:hypothetical protein